MRLSVDSHPDLDCRTCGACCSGLVVDVEVDDTTPRHLAKEDRLLGWIMRQRKGTQCIAFRGIIGCLATCSIYENRPAACRDFTPGCDKCISARKWAGREVWQPGHQEGNAQ